MKILKHKLIIFVCSYFLVLALYWPAMHGTPIWDDSPYWFDDPMMGPSMSYLTIFKNFAWPVSVSFQKVLFSFFKKNYFLYHLLSLTIHFFNAILVYRLAKFLQVKRPLLFYFIFLVHPVCVISAAWMIQIKTLLCFFFGLSSLLTFIKGNRNLCWMIASWILFLLSITSKSASLTLPIIFLFISYRFFRLRKIHLLLPFFLISSWGFYKVVSSPVTIEGTQKAVKISETSRVTPPEISHIPESTPPISMSADSNQVKQDIPSALDFVLLDFKMLPKTLYYYFWQTIVPIRNIPVRGLNTKDVGPVEIGHLVFLFLIILFCWKDLALLYLAAGHFLLLPFLGIIPAPYMTITWVSDQHLYLVLPAFLAFGTRLVDKIKWRYSFTLPVLFGIFFMYKTFETAPYYKDQISFYKSSLDFNPTNVPITYNLAVTYLLQNKLQEARAIINNIYNLGADDPMIRNNEYYADLIILYINILPTEKNREN